MNTQRLPLLPVLLILLSSCGPGKEDASTYATPAAPLEKPSLAVLAVRVEESPGSIRIEGAGRIEGIRESDVLSETSGEIQSVNFEMGDFIREGDVLLTVEDELPRLAYDSAGKELRAAELEFEALDKSYKTGGTSLIDYQKGLARLAAVRLRASEASEAYRNTRIRAPYSGYAGVREKGINPGSILRKGDTVTHLVDRSSFQIRLSVGEDEIPLIRKGDQARVHVGALGDYRIDARVKAVSPGGLNGGGGFPVWIGWENGEEDEVKPGMSARVSIMTSHRGREYLFLPGEAIQTRDGDTVVFRVSDGKAEAVPLQYGRTLDGRIFQSRGPLLPGDLIIVSGFGTLLSGDPVTVTEASGGPAP